MSTGQTKTLKLNAEVDAGSTPGTGGYLEGPSQRLDIRHILPFGTPSNLAVLPVNARTAVGDVASVQIGHQPLIGNALVNGTPGPRRRRRRRSWR